MVNLLKKQLTANEIRYRTYDYITTRRRSSCIPAMHRIHGGTPATAVRSGSRPAPLDSRYLADQKGSGRPLRYRIQAMGEKEVTDCKKYTANGLVCRGCPLTSQTAFGGQFPYKGSLVQPVVRFGHTYSCMMVGFYEPRMTNHEPLFFHEPRRPANCGQRSAGRQALNSTNDLRRTDLRRGLRPSFPGNPEIYEIAEEANP